jgi:hypothetical protein
MANPLEIYLEDASEHAELEAINRGYRLDVYVKLGELFFKVAIYDIVRIKQEFEIEVEAKRYYAIGPNLILVKEVSFGEIKLTVAKLVEQKFFDELKPLNDQLIQSLNLTKS